MTSDTTPATKDKPVSGFAVLEAKVEEIQAQTHNDAAVAELAPSTFDESAGMAATEGTPTTSTSGDLASVSPEGDGSLTPSVARGISVLSALQDSVFDVVRLQSETFARFAQVRGPGDLLSAQFAYGQRVFELQMDIWSRVAKAAPAVPPFAR